MAGELVDFDKVRASLAAKGLENGGDGGDSGGMDMLEKRIARLEILAESTDKRFDKIDAKLDGLSADVRALTVSVAKLEGTVAHLPKVGDLFRLMLWTIGVTGAATALPQIIPAIAKLITP